MSYFPEPHTHTKEKIKLNTHTKEKIKYSY